MTAPAPGATLVAALFDVSYSMAPWLDEMTGSINGLIAEQAKVPGGGALMLAEFAAEYQIVIPLRSLTGAPRYAPALKSGTAIYDAIVSYIADINEVLSDEQVYRRVVVPIVTDGQDVSSRLYDLEAARGWIEYQRAAYSWDFVFLGANIDAEKTAAALGIPRKNALTFSTRNSRESIALMNRHVTELRAGDGAGFSDQDRRKAIGR